MTKYPGSSVHHLYNHHSTFPGNISCLFLLTDDEIFVSRPARPQSVLAVSTLVISELELSQGQFHFQLSNSSVVWWCGQVVWSDSERWRARPAGQITRSVQYYRVGVVLPRCLCAPGSPLLCCGHKVRLCWLHEGGDISSVRLSMPRLHQTPLLLLLFLSLTFLTRLSAGAWNSELSGQNDFSERHQQKDWLLSRIQSINQKEVQKITRQEADRTVEAAISKLRSRKSFTTEDLKEMSVTEAKQLLMDVEDLLVSEKGDFVSDRQGRGLWDMFSSLADIRTDSTLIRGGNSTGDERGILDFALEVAGSLIGGVSNKNDGPVLIPNHCW